MAGSSAEEFWQKWYEQELFASFRELPEQKRKSWLEQRRSLEPAAIASQLRNLGPARHEDLFPVLNSLGAQGVRILFLAGELDPKYSALAQKIASIPGAEVEIFPGVGHIVPLEAPEALALRIKKFIR